MRMLRYPDYEAHKQDHDQLFEQIENLASRLEKGHKSANFELLRLLQQWMSQHVLNADSNFSAYFKFQGMEPAGSEQRKSSFFSKMLWK